MRKHSFYILLIVTAVIMCACGKAEYVFPDNGRFSETPVLKVSQMPGEEYAEAEIDGMPAEIKLRGNSTKESEKKSFNIKFEEPQEMLGMEPGKKWCVIGQPFDKSLIRTVIGFDYAAALGIKHTPQARLCDVWIGDRYMGVYTVSAPVEVPDAQFLLERNFDRVESDKAYVESLSGMRFEFNEPETPNGSQLKECQKILENVELTVSTLDHEKYEQVIDVDSFVNFYIFNEMIKDVDFGVYSTRYYFMDGVLHAGPPWDLDLTMGNVSASKGETNYDEYQNQELWCSGKDFYYWLCRDPWFMQKVRDRWDEVRPVTEALSSELIDQYVAAHSESIDANYEIWDVSVPEHVTEWQEPAADYQGNIDMLKSWLDDRFKYLEDELERN